MPVLAKPCCYKLTQDAGVGGAVQGVHARGQAAAAHGGGVALGAASATLRGEEKGRGDRWVWDSCCATPRGEDKRGMGMRYVNASG